MLLATRRGIAIDQPRPLVLSMLIVTLLDPR